MDQFIAEYSLGQIFSRADSSGINDHDGVSSGGAPVVCEILRTNISHPTHYGIHVRAWDEPEVIFANSTVLAMSASG